MRELRKDAAFLGAARDADVGAARRERARPGAPTWRSWRRRRPTSRAVARCGVAWSCTGVLVTHGWRADTRMLDVTIDDCWMSPDAC